MKISNLNDENFNNKVLICKAKVITYFWATWCNPCKALSPIIEELSKELEHLFYKIDVHHNSIHANKYQVRSIPTLLLFQAGVLNEHRIVGLTTKNNIKQWIMTQ